MTRQAQDAICETESYSQYFYNLMTGRLVLSTAKFGLLLFSPEGEYLCAMPRRQVMLRFPVVVVPSRRDSFDGDDGAREIPEFTSCADDRARVHSHLPVRFDDATGYFHSSSKKRR